MIRCAYEARLQRIARGDVQRTQTATVPCQFTREKSTYFRQVYPTPTRNAKYVIEIQFNLYEPIKSTYQKKPK